MNPITALLVDMHKRSNAALDRAERIMLSSLDGLDTLEPGDVDQYGHTYDHPEFEKLDELKEQLDRQNIVYIHGIAYELSSWGDPYEDGSRQATLRVWRPF